MSNLTDFAPRFPLSTCFVVQNIAPYRKRIKIFNYPIENGDVRDLLAIPEVSEADIRAGLLKGQILRKLQAKEITIVCSNIDLLQFNPDQKVFLQESGIQLGLEVGYDELTPEVQALLQGAAGATVTFHENISLTGTLDGTNRTFSTPGKFIQGPYLGSDYSIDLFHNGRRCVPSAEYLTIESSPGTGYDTIVFITFVPTASSVLRANYVTKI